MIIVVGSCNFASCAVVCNILFGLDALVFSSYTIKAWRLRKINMVLTIAFPFLIFHNVLATHVSSANATTGSVLDVLQSIPVFEMHHVFKPRPALSNIEFLVWLGCKS